MQVIIKKKSSKKEDIFDLSVKYSVVYPCFNTCILKNILDHKQASRYTNLDSIFLQVNIINTSYK